MVDYLREIAKVYVGEDWVAPDWLIDPDDANRINAEQYIKPGQFEPGARGGASTGSDHIPAQASAPVLPPSFGGAAGSTSDLRDLMPSAPSTAAAPPAGGSADTPEFDELEARFNQLKKGP